MTRATYRFLKVTMTIGVGLGCLLVNERASLTDPSTLVTEAQARIGRPLTPLSYAGVARRTTRRAVYAGAAVGAAAYAAPVVVAPAAACYRAVDAYGRIYTRCP
jgi:hypothetical protein